MGKLVMDSTVISSLILAIGGAAVAGVVARGGAKEARRYEDRKKAFDGILSAYRDLAAGHSEERAKVFGYWQLQVELVGSDNVVAALKTLAATEPGTNKRVDAQNDFVRAMRNDLRR